MSNRDDLWVRDMGRDMGLRESETAIFMEGTGVSTWDTESVDDASSNGDDKAGGVGGSISGVGETVYRELYRETDMCRRENDTRGQRKRGCKFPHGKRVDTGRWNHDGPDQNRGKK
jgi:hypothetical protein